MTHTEWIPFHMVLALKWLGWHLCPGAWAREQGPSLRASYNYFLPSQYPWQADLSPGCHPKGGCCPGGWKCPPAWLYPGGQRDHIWCWGLEEEEGSSVKLVCLLTMLMTRLYFRECWVSLGVVWLGFCVSVVSRALQLSLFHGDALLGNSPVPWAKHNSQGPCVPQPSVPAWAGGQTLKEDGMGKGSHCGKNSLPLLAELTSAK